MRRQARKKYWRERKKDGTSRKKHRISVGQKRRKKRRKGEEKEHSNLIPARKHDKAKHLSFSQPALF